MQNLKTILVLILGSVIISPVIAEPTQNFETQTAEYFATIKNDPLQVYMFLANMPKGGDLHNHLSGAAYAEDLIKYGKNDNFCVNPTNFTLAINPQCPTSLQLANAENKPNFYRLIVENWSLKDFKPGEENQLSCEVHFFPTFIKFGPIVGKHTDEVLSEVVARAGAEHVSYLELMLTPYDLGLVDAQGNELAAALGKHIGWNNDLTQLHKKLLANGLNNIVSQISKRIDAAEAAMRIHLQCGTPNADPGCQVKVRYQYLALRELFPEQFFAQLVTAFAAAKTDPRIVGINIVQAEDGPIAVRDYNLHMQMVHFLHQLYPQAHITLHAGELAPGNVPPEILRYHIRQAVETGDAERIGHGTDVAYEDNAAQLLQEMATKHILVEECLTSNVKLLGVKGNRSPFLLYLRNRVPVALATDDEGVFRTDLTREYQRAVLNYNLTYPTLKMLARNSLTYAFLPGVSLWQNPDTFIPIASCKSDQLGSVQPSKSCAQFLAQSQKAQLQWQLEKQFNDFEKKIATNDSINGNQVIK